MNVEIVANLVSDPGCCRKQNEDSGIFVRPWDPRLLEKKGVLLVVADGMGGHEAGEVASRMAVETVRTFYFAHDGAPEDALKTAFTEANRAIWAASRTHAALNGMGTTCTALAVVGDRAFAAHVGDSRLYLIRAGRLYLMTEDDSEVMELARRGLLTREEARAHPNKNVITRALGTKPDVAVHVWDKPLRVHSGDRFLVCSDGLHDLIADEEIRDIILSNQTEDAGWKLVALARERGGFDNITAGVLHLRPASADQARTARATREVEVAI